MDSYKHFRMAISSLMNNKGLKQAEFGAIIGVSQSTVSYWFNGKKEPNMSHILAICHAFEVNPNELLGISKYTEKYCIDKDNKIL